MKTKYTTIFFIAIIGVSLIVIGYSLTKIMSKSNTQYSDVPESPIVDSIITSIAFDNWNCIRRYNC